MTSVRAVPPAVYDQDEKSFCDQIMELAGIFRWRTAHFRPARTVHGWRTPVQGDGAGFPDLILLKDGRLVVAELKSRRGRLTREQLDWLQAWRDVGAQVFVWKPSDWPDIERVLTR